MLMRTKTNGNVIRDAQRQSQRILNDQALNAASKTRASRAAQILAREEAFEDQLKLDERQQHQRLLNDKAVARVSKTRASRAAETLSREEAFEEALKLDERRQSQRILNDQLLEDELYETQLSRPQTKSLAVSNKSLINTVKKSEDFFDNIIEVEMPNYVYTIDNLKNTYTLRFKLPGNEMITHKFHKDEPFNTVLLQIKYDMQYSGGLIFILPPSYVIDCDLNTPISECEIKNYKTILVAKV